MNNMTDVKEKLSPLKRQELLKDLWRWSDKLNSSEFQVVFFIYMRTILYGKYWELIMLRHFLKGVPNTQIGPVSIEKRQLQNIIKKLLECDLIRRKPHYSSYRYSINFEWDGNLEVNTDVYKSKIECNEKHGEVQRAAPGSAVNCMSYKQENKEHKNNKKKNKESGKKSPRSINDNVFKKNTNLSDNKEIISIKKIKVPDLEILWLGKIKELYPEYICPAWTAKECGKIKFFLEFLKREHPQVDVIDFLYFTLESWWRIGSLRFSWMKNISYPEYPSMDFLMGFKKVFLLAFADDKFHEHQLGHTSREREIRKFKRMGYTQAQAEKAVNEASKEKNDARVQKYAEQAIKSQRQIDHLCFDKKNLEKKIRFQMIEMDKLIQTNERNSQSKGRKKLPNEKARKRIKRDRDGYAIFED